MNARYLVLKKMSTPLLAALLVLWVYLFGCPIKFWTGISCPGCGLTRAWTAALSLHFDLAMAYHPLFWSVPLLFAFVLAKDHIPQKAYNFVLLLVLIAFLALWAIRLAMPNDTNVLFSNVLSEDIVSIDAPVWLTYIRSLMIR